MRGGDKVVIFFRYNRQCALAITCRLIKAESTEILWRSAVCSAVRKLNPSAVWLHHLRRALPQYYARNIVHLQNVCIPATEEVETWSLESVNVSLLGFPGLQTCGVTVGYDDTVIDHGSMVEVVTAYGPLSIMNLWQRWRGTGLDRRLLQFTGPRNASTQKFLRDFTGIKVSCGVHMIMQVELSRLPIQCSMSASGEKVGASLPSVSIPSI